MGLAQATCGASRRYNGLKDDKSKTFAKTLPRKEEKKEKKRKETHHL